MNFAACIDLFCGGKVPSVKYGHNMVGIELISCPITLQHDTDPIELDAYNRISGFLVVNGLRNTIVNNRPYRGPISVDRDDGRIRQLEIWSNRVKVVVKWYENPCEGLDEDIACFILEGNQILWENSPNPVTLDLTGINAKISDQVRLHKPTRGRDC
jgi:hypothetical protein